MPGKLISPSEGLWSTLMAAASTPLFVLSPVGLTFLLGEASVADQKNDPVRRSQRAVTVMSALTHSTLSRRSRSFLWSRWEFPSRACPPDRPGRSSTPLPFMI